MKKKLIIFCFVAVATVSAVLYVQSKSNLQDDLLLANVEALADDEEPNIFCRSKLFSACEQDQDHSCYFTIVNKKGEDIPCFISNYRNNI